MGQDDKKDVMQEVQEISHLVYIQYELCDRWAMYAFLLAFQKDSPLNISWKKRMFRLL